MSGRLVGTLVEKGPLSFGSAVEGGRLLRVHAAETLQNRAITHVHRGPLTSSQWTQVRLYRMMLVNGMTKQA